jgi:hypothetical protein
MAGPRRWTSSAAGASPLAPARGSDRFGGELSATGERLGDRLRGQMPDEALQIFTAAWSGQPVHHRGEHYRRRHPVGITAAIAGLRQYITAPFDVAVALLPGSGSAP